MWQPVVCKKMSAVCGDIEPHLPTGLTKYQYLAWHSVLERTFFSLAVDVGYSFYYLLLAFGGVRRPVRAPGL